MKDQIKKKNVVCLKTFKAKKEKKQRQAAVQRAIDYAQTLDWDDGPKEG